MLSDTLLEQAIGKITNANDTIIAHLDLVSKTVNEIKHESLFLKLLPFIGVIVGGVLTYFGQWILKNREEKSATKRASNECIHKVFYNFSALKFALKELAYLHIDIKYQLYQSIVEKDADLKKKALEEHYEDYKYISDVKNKITISCSEIISAFGLFHKLKEQTIPANIELIINTSIDKILVFEPVSDYDHKSEIRAGQIEKDIKTFEKEYYTVITDFYAITGQFNQ